MSKYIIKTTDNKYFAGWNNLGHIIFTNDKALAYRMLCPVAQNTFEKIDSAKIIETVD